MWTKTKSLFLSRMLTIAAAFLLLIMTFFMPAISKWYADISVSGGVFGKCDIVIPMCCSATSTTIRYLSPKTLPACAGYRGYA